MHKTQQEFLNIAHYGVKTFTLWHQNFQNQGWNMNIELFSGIEFPNPISKHLKSNISKQDKRHSKSQEENKDFTWFSQPSSNYIHRVRMILYKNKGGKRKKKNLNISLPL